MSFIASDIYSFVTAVSVANTYQVQIDVDTAEFFMMALVLVALLLKLDKVKLFKWKGRIVYAIVSCMIFAGFTQVYVYSDYLEDIGVDFRVYRPQYKYRYYGTLLTTMRTFGYLHVTQPEEYSVNAVKKITKQYTENESTETQEKNTSTQNKTTKKPNVIAIMNESFADLKAVGDLQTSKDYMPFFRKLKENAIKGYTYSSVFGGNTANSEFEFMTGNTLAFLPDNSVPYQLFLRSKTAGLTYTLKDQGYSPCYALHPFYKTGYGRYKVYPLMGFDKFYTSDNFSVFTDTVNYHITDSEDYKKLISLYENRTDKDKPFYLFNVTMQNHGSYDGSTLETGDEVQIEGDLQSYSKAEQYLNMIKMSDKALKELVHYFEKVEETAKQLREVLGEMPILFTFRTSKEGGEKAIETPVYVELNQKISATGYVDLVDMEAFTGDDAVKAVVEEAHKHGVKVVASNHDFDKTPAKSDIIYRLRKMQELGADIPKIAVMPQNKKDVLTLLAATEEMVNNYADRPIITMSMAATGVISRVCGEVFGSALTFGAVGKASAPGQMGAGELKEMLTTLHASL